MLHVMRTMTLALAAMLIPGTAFAAEGLPGADMSLLWAIPFAGLLLSIATGPLLFPHVWEHHYGKIAAGWAALALIPMIAAHGFGTALGAVLHTMLLEYMSFIILLFALFTISGGILVAGNIHGTPAVNACLLLLGALLASVIGTTGASMVMIRPIIRANDNRPFNAHVVIFFIFLVSNIGGSLTPLGDPPLFVGFLRGVDFFWTTKHLFPETLFTAGIVLAVFFVLDTLIYRREGVKRKDPTPDNPVRIKGGLNFVLIFVIIGAILMSATVDLGSITVLGVPMTLQDLLRDAIMVAVTVISLKATPKTNHKANGFSWGPIREVAILFAGIFATIIPVLAMLRAGSAGPFAPLIALVTGPDGAPNNAAYFWLTGGLSSFLDNAPTYLVFFQMAGGDPNYLMREGALTLAAISAGAVFMGANTYIGNAPNFMVYAIARQSGVKMPSFFGYMLWSGCVLIPTFALATLIFFRG